MKIKTPGLTMAGLAFALACGGCDPNSAANPTTSQVSPATAKSQHSIPSAPESHALALTALSPDEPLANHQIQLLELAMESATAIPMEPHVKDRCRAQQNVLMACLALNQPRPALEYAQQIENWRQGEAYANIAFYCAQRQELKPVPLCMALAAHVADATEDWPRDLIRVRIAQTHALLNQAEEAEQLQADAAETQPGKIDSIRARTLSPEQLEAQLTAVDARLATANFDVVRNALDQCVSLFDRFYSDEPRRSQIQRRIIDGSKRMPSTIRVDILLSLAAIALDRSDRAGGLDLVNLTHEMLAPVRWTPEDQIPVMARIAAARHRTGDRARAVADLQEAMQQFEDRRDEIMNIDRSDVLRAVAEAYATMEDEAASLATYKRALEAGIENPNSRPRAEDLSALCSSMAVHAVQPDAELFIRLRQVREGLSDPW